MLEVIKAKVLKNRAFNLSKTEWGVQDEKNVIQLQFEFPEELNEYNKWILFEFDDDKSSFKSVIFNNIYTIDNNITKHLKFDIEIVFEDESGNRRFKSKKRTINMEKGITTDEIPPTPEQLSEWNTLVTTMNDKIVEVEVLKIGIDNINIDAVKEGTVTTISITNADGVEKVFEILDGKDYILTAEDKQEISKITKPLVEESIAPVLEQNLQESKHYADTIKPTKTSELTNDSNFAKTNQNNNFSAGQTINGTLTINGNIVQNGEEYETHAEKVFTKNDEIITRDGAVGGLSEEQFAGILAMLYDGINNGRLGFNAKGEARVGDVGDEQPLLTRDEIVNLQEGQVLVWDSANLKAVGSSNYIKNSDYATSSKAGLIRPANGLFISGTTGALLIAKASNAQIDAKTDSYYPIVPSNLDYAVGSVKASETQSGTIKVWTSTNDEGEIGLNISTEV